MQRFDMHFVDGKLTEENPDPVNACNYSANTPKSRKPRRQHCDLTCVSDKAASYLTKSIQPTEDSQGPDSTWTDHTYCLTSRQSQDLSSTTLDETADVGAALKVQVEQKDQDGQSEHSRQGRITAQSSNDSGVQTRRQQREVCCVAHCNSQRKQPITMSFFPFPREEARCKEWVQNCGQRELIGKSPILLRNKGYKVCCKHFEESQFRSSGPGVTKRLLPDALPTIFENSKKSRPRKGQEKKSGSLGEWRRMELSSLAEPLAGGALDRIQADHQYTSEMPEVKVEMDYAENPALYWTTLQTMPDVAPEQPAFAETATTGQFWATDSEDIKMEPMDTMPDTTTLWSLTDSVDIKVEPTDAHTDHVDITSEFQDVKTEPLDSETQSVDGEVEGQGNTNHVDVKTEHLDIKTEPPDSEVESSDSEAKTRFRIQVSDTRTDPLDFTSQSQEFRVELEDIKTEPEDFYE